MMLFAWLFAVLLSASAAVGETSFSATPVWLEGRTTERNLTVGFRVDEIAFCRGTVPLSPDAVLRVDWRKTADGIKVSYETPQGWTVEEKTPSPDLARRASHRQTMRTCGCMETE